MKQVLYDKLVAQVEAAYERRIKEVEVAKVKELAAIRVVADLNKEVLYEKGRYGTGVAAIRAVIKDMEGTFTNHDIEVQLQIVAPTVVATRGEGYLDSALCRLVKLGELVILEENRGPIGAIYGRPELPEDERS